MYKTLKNSYSNKRELKIQISYNLKVLPTLIKQKTSPLVLLVQRTNQINLYLKDKVPFFHSYLSKKLV